MAGKPFTYFDIARIARNMHSKEIEPYANPLERAAEFVKLEESMCYLMVEWLKNYEFFEEFVGVGFGFCFLSLIGFLDVMNSFRENNWEGFSGGEFGGAGASGGFGIHFPWEGNPLKP